MASSERNEIVERDQEEKDKSEEIVKDSKVGKKNEVREGSVVWKDVTNDCKVGNDREIGNNSKIVNDGEIGEAGNDDDVEKDCEVKKNKEVKKAEKIAKNMEVRKSKRYMYDGADNVQDEDVYSYFTFICNTKGPTLDPEAEATCYSFRIKYNKEIESFQFLQNERVQFAVKCIDGDERTRNTIIGKELTTQRENKILYSIRCDKIETKEQKSTKSHF